MMKIKELILAFENCDAIEIPGKYIGYFEIGNIKKKISTLAVGHVEEMDVAGLVAIEIFKEANELYYEFGFHGYQRSKFNRIIGYNDITMIEFDADVDGVARHYAYYPTWSKSSSDESNLWQVSKVSDLGNLYIFINKKSDKFDVYFPNSRINDESYINFSKKRNIDTYD